MKVFVVPIGVERYQLYVELPREPPVPDADVPAGGCVARQVTQYTPPLEEAAEQRLRRERGEPSVTRGLGRKIMGRIAEAVAEQRLLWGLRNQTRVDLVHPDDLGRDQALSYVNSEFTRDVSKHRRWMVIDGLIAAITGPLFFFVPGPNIISWYFTFRAVGHFLSWRGALKGLSGIAWTPMGSAPLTSVRYALTLPSAERCSRLDAITIELGLQHLTGFVERVREREKAANSR